MFSQKAQPFKHLEGKVIPVASKNSWGWKSIHRICPLWNLKSCRSFPAVRSHTFTMLSSPPVTIHRPSGVNRIDLIAPLWPLYVWRHPFFFISQILRSVSEEPDAKNSPNGWNSTAVQLDLCPVRDRTTAFQLKTLIRRPVLAKHSSRY